MSLLSHVRKYVRWYVLLILIISSVALWFGVFREDRNGILTFAVLDVGQGDALFIESPTGTQVVIDGGPNRNLMKEISGVMPWYDRHIDMIFITNPDKDHYEGFIPLLDQYKVDTVIESGTQSQTDTYAYIQNKILLKNISKIVGLRGQVIDLGDGAYIEILFPDRDVSGLTPNNGSLVMRLVYGDTSVLLQGDSTANIENYLLTLDGEKLRSTILKTGHHGSRTSTTEEYVKVVDPRWAVISAGKNNTYGHPHKETLDILSKQRVPVLGTYDMGRIIFKSNGKEFKVEK